MAGMGKLEGSEAKGDIACLKRCAKHWKQAVDVPRSFRSIGQISL